MEHRSIDIHTCLEYSNTMKPNTLSPKLIFAAALACLPLGVSAADYGNRPIILDVHGLDFHQFTCSDFKTLNAALGMPAAAAQEAPCTMLGMGIALFKQQLGEYHNDYFAKDIERLCPDCDRRDFTWSGAIHDSRAVVDQLSASVRSLSAEARSAKRPFVIVSHSWGTVLAAETLAEMDVNGEDISVDQLVTLASPLGGAFYKSAINDVIPDSMFFQAPRRARFVKNWINYYSKRDVISHSLALADYNVSMDSYIDTASYETKIQAFLSGYLHGQYPTTPSSVRDEAFQSLDQIKLGPTVSGAMIWHSCYMEPISIYLAGADDTFNTDLGPQFAAYYFNPPSSAIWAAKAAKK